MPTRFNEGNTSFLMNSASISKCPLKNKAGHQPHTIHKNETQMDQISKYDSKNNKTLQKEVLD